MTTRPVQFGSSTALLALAVVVSMGSVADVQAGAALVRLPGQGGGITVVGDREAVAQWFSRLNSVVRLLGGEDAVHGHGQSAHTHAAVVAPGFVDLTPTRTAWASPTGLTPPPRPPLPASHLIDLPPPAAIR